MKLNLRNKFLLPTSAAVAVVFTTLLLLTVNLAGNALHDSVTADMVEICEALTGTIETWVEDRDHATRRWAELPEVAQVVEGAGDASVASAALARLARNTPEAEGLYVTDGRGKVVAASNPDVVGKLDLSERAYFQECRRTRQTAFSELIRSKATGNAVLAICQPVGRDGALVTAFELSELAARVIEPIKIGETGYAYVLDAGGTVVAHPDHGLILEHNVSGDEWGREILASGTGQLAYEFKGVAKQAAFHRFERLGWTTVLTVDEAQFLAPVHRIRNLGLLMTLGALAIVAAVIFLVARAVTGPVSKMIDELNAGAEQTASAATQISSSSTELAGQASEQAAAVQETTASLEQMNGSVQATTANTGRCRDLMTETQQVVGRGLQEMQAMVAAIDKIKNSSDETARIVQTIDEIAFQTNLLALNAAVEAARAGEAGKGFAVVAEEVRNLAQRAAQAARDTSELIAGSVQHAGEGVAVASRTREAFEETAASAEKVAAIVGEVAEAAREQSQAIGQINEAVGQMDRAAQGTAASAEESASASEELNAQAEQLRAVVGALHLLIAGGQAGASLALAPPAADADDARWHALADSGAGRSGVAAR